MITPIDKAGSLASGYADLILDDLLNSNAILTQADASVSAGGWPVTVVVARESPGGRSWRCGSEGGNCG